MQTLNFFIKKNKNKNGLYQLVFFLLCLQEHQQQQTAKEPYGLNLAMFPTERDTLIYQR